MRIIIILSTYMFLAIAYFGACLLRGSSGVVLPTVASHISMTPSAIGLVSGMFFYGYALVQPYYGKLCDKRNPVIVISSGLIILSIGLILFATTSSSIGLCVARFVMGVGVGPTFCGILVYQARTFSPKTYAKFMGLTIMLGHLGGVVGVTPMGSALDKFGYVLVHYALALISVVVAIILFITNRNNSCTVQHPKDTARESLLHGFRIIFASSQLRVIASIWCIAMSLQLTLFGLWGVTWITSLCKNVSLVNARFCMSIGGIGVLIGASIAGIYGNTWIKVNKILCKICLALVCMLLFLICSIDFINNYLSIVAFSCLLGILIGVSNVMCNIMLFRAVGNELIGTVTGANNVIIFLIVLFSQWISGFIIEKLSNCFAISAFAIFFGIILIFGIISLAILHKKNI